MLPAYHQTPSLQLHTSPSSQQDQSLHQLVQSRIAADPEASRCCLGASPQQLHTHHEAVPKPGKHPQAASPKLTKRQSGNPFARDYQIEERSAGLRQCDSSSLSRGASGNPFAGMSEMNSESSRLASSQDQAVNGHLAGHLPNVGSKVAGVLCLGIDIESDVAAAGSVQGHAQPSTQQALSRCAGLSAHPACSASMLRNPEMSPLQNGLIRCSASPCSCILTVDAVCRQHAHVILYIHFHVFFG